MTDNENIRKQIYSQAMEEAISIVNRNMKKWGHKLPDMSDAGVYNVWDKDQIHKTTSWRTGFGIGIMWLLYEYTGDKKYMDNATGMIDVFLQRQNMPDQCQGVMNLPSCVPAYKYTQSTKAAKLALDSADTLMKQFEEKGQYFKAFKDYKNFVVDTAVNTVLLHWASSYTGNPLYYDTAKKQLATELKYTIRPDGSTYHVYWFDDDGNPLEGSTAQGYDDKSCWSRGQAWAMLGFSLHYRFTGDEKYAQAFKKLSTYYFSHLNSDMIPSWDLIFTDCGQYADSAAAAIAICAVLEMAKLLPEDKEVAQFKEQAILSMLSLIKNYSTSYEDYIDVLLVGGCDNVLRHRYDEGLIYGDYFYLEALLRLLTDFDTFWQ